MICEMFNARYVWVHISRKIICFETTMLCHFQSCLTLCDLMDCSLPGSSVHGILTAGILQWVAMPSCRGSSPSRYWICISYVSCSGRWIFLPLVPPGKPTTYLPYIKTNIIHFTNIYCVLTIASHCSRNWGGNNWRHSLKDNLKKFCDPQGASVLVDGNS